MTGKKSLEEIEQLSNEKSYNRDSKLSALDKAKSFVRDVSKLIVMCDEKIEFLANDKNVKDDPEFLESIAYIYNRLKFTKTAKDFSHIHLPKADKEKVEEFCFHILNHLVSVFGEKYLEKQLSFIKNANLAIKENTLIEKDADIEVEISDLFEQNLVCDINDSIIYEIESKGEEPENTYGMDINTYDDLFGSNNDIFSNKETNLQKGIDALGFMVRAYKA